MIFSQRPNAFPSDEAKINYIIGLLRGTALVWAQVVNVHTHLNTLLFDEFVCRFEHIFNRPDHAGCASNRLFRLPQSSCLVAEYTVEFSMLATWWDEVARPVPAQVIWMS